MAGGIVHHSIAPVGRAPRTAPRSRQWIWGAARAATPMDGRRAGPPGSCAPGDRARSPGMRSISCAAHPPGHGVASGHTIPPVRRERQRNNQRRAAPSCAGVGPAGEAAPGWRSRAAKPAGAGCSSPPDPVNIDQIRRPPAARGSGLGGRRPPRPRLQPPAPHPPPAEASIPGVRARSLPVRSPGGRRRGSC
jgi:hypothetical protein